MLMLGIETSCDETSVAVLRDGHEVLSNLVASQIELHRVYGGVVPELACRKHVEVLHPLAEEAVRRAGITLRKLDAVSVTCGPGLVGALVVGVAAAKALAWALNVPLIGVNHLEGHIYANFLENPELPFPLICLLVSGGHTAVVLMRGHGQFERLGETRDDAAGEAFDKVARVMGLGYPGGPIIDKLAAAGDRALVPLPRGMLHDKSYEFSF
ncbi:MAG: tRNA (adenosine(37)-N6)-threonylcarbamoyltransferase complex transferase subunit TsaD, partial [Candidatus Xenobia bacterium]